MESKLFPLCMLVAGWFIGTSGEPSATPVEAETSTIVKYEAPPQCPACDCDYEDRIASLEADVAKLMAAEESTPAREATPEPPGAVDNATSAAAPAGLSNSLASVADSYSGPNWTYPGTIDGHLASTHGVSQSETAGMTQRQKERLHASIHQQGVTTRVVSQPRVIYQQPSRVTYSSSNCPGGVCPVNRSYSQPKRQGLFRRIFSR